MIHLDNNATTRPCDAARAAAGHAADVLWGNPSSVHRAGQAARHAVELARAEMAALLGVTPRSIVFTSSGTESIDLAIRGSLAATGRGVIVTTRVEHASVRDLCEDLARRGAAEVRWAPLTPSGLVDLDALDAMLDPGVAIASIQWANNETGTIQPVAEIARRCRARGVRFHTDAVQAVGKIPLGLGGEEGPDLLSASAHKFHGLKGVGVLWLRPGVAVAPTLLGTQELGRRGGTENVPGILAAGAAAREAAEWLADPTRAAAQGTLRDRFERHVLGRLSWAVGNAPGAARLWNTSNLAFPRLEAEPILMMLSERGVFASAGAACSSGSLEPSPVLLALGIEPERAHGSIRFSLSRETTEREIDEAARLVVECVTRLRASTSGVVG